MNKKYIKKLRTEIQILLRQNMSLKNRGELRKYQNNCMKIVGINYALDQYKRMEDTE